MACRSQDAEISNFRLIRSDSIARSWAPEACRAARTDYHTLVIYQAEKNSSDVTFCASVLCPSVQTLGEGCLELTRTAELKIIIFYWCDLLLSTNDSGVDMMFLTQGLTEARINKSWEEGSSHEAQKRAHGLSEERRSNNTNNTTKSTAKKGKCITMTAVVPRSYLHFKQVIM